MNLFCTVITRSHLPFVRALAESLATSGNPEPLHVLVADADTGELANSEGAVRFYGFDTVAAELPPLIRHYFDAFELCNALKPFLVTRLFQEGADKVIYLDSDILVTGSFSPVWNGFGAASLLLTPHLLSPPSLDTRSVNEIEIVDMGFLNGGFSAWHAGEAAERMLAWLRSRLPVYGFCDRRRGMFVDQKLMPLLLQYYPDDITVLRHPELNVAFWNARERAVQTASPGRWVVGDTPVVFFHLSGYRLEKPEHPCSYLPDEVNATIRHESPWIVEVMAAYRERLTRHFSGHTHRPYAFNRFDGILLNREYRTLLFQTGGLDRRTRAFRLAWLRQQLRTLKRCVTSLVTRRHP